VFGGGVWGDDGSKGRFRTCHRTGLPGADSHKTTDKNVGVDKIIQMKAKYYNYIEKLGVCYV
jgi:hypothetical protein